MQETREGICPKLHPPDCTGCMRSINPDGSSTPDDRHCFHDDICCQCGGDRADGHGPHYPRNATKAAQDAAFKRFVRAVGEEVRRKKEEVARA